MDLNKQPPRRPSNRSMAGIAGLARMTDKARGYNAELLGDYVYGKDSKLDMSVLAFINMGPDDFADAADEFNDAALAALALDKSAKDTGQIEDFNRGKLQAEPADQHHRDMLAERVALYAPERKDVNTIFQSIELDDWGVFRHRDLSQAAPRSPFLRSVFGVIGLARGGDKARAAVGAALGEYNYGQDSKLDQFVLGFLGIDFEAFKQAAYANPNDTELGEWVAAKTAKSRTEISAFNAQMSSLGLHGEVKQFVEEWRAELCPERGDLRTIFDLMDYDDQETFDVVDLTRQPPRSPFDRGVGGVTGLARMIDKARATNTGTVGAYWYGEESGIDRRILEFLGIGEKDFAAALQETKTDAAIVTWLGQRLAGKSEEQVDAFNADLESLAPSNKRQEDFLNSAMKKLDPGRDDIAGFLAMTALDDAVSFARFKAGV
jgi:hypothetical protein